MTDETPSVRIDIDIESNITEKGERKFKQGTSVSMSKDFAQKVKDIKSQDEAKLHKLVNKEIKQIGNAVSRLAKHDQALERKQAQYERKVEQYAKRTERKNQRDFDNLMKSIFKSLGNTSKKEKAITTPRDLIWSYQDVKEQDFQTPLPSSSTRGSVVPSPRDVKGARRNRDMSVMAKTAKQIERERKAALAEERMRQRNAQKKYKATLTSGRSPIDASSLWGLAGVGRPEDYTPLPSSATQGSVVPSPRDVKDARKNQDMAIMSKTAKQLVRDQRAADAEARTQARNEHKKYKATLTSGKMPLDTSDPWGMARGMREGDDPVRTGSAVPIFSQGFRHTSGGAPYGKKIIPLEERKFMEFMEKKSQQVGGLLYTGMRGGALMGDAERFMTTNLLRLLASRAGLIGSLSATAITTALGAPKVANSMVQLLTRKGSPANMDFHRHMEQEQNALWDIEDKKRRLMGLDAYVITQHDTYSPVDGTPVYNSYENRQETRVSKVIGLAEKAVGIE